MKKRLAALGVLAILLSACNTKPQSAAEIISRVKDNYEKHRSITYKIYYRAKYFSEPDTSNLNAVCKLVRDTTDKLFNWHVWILVNDIFETYYNQRRMYSVNRGTKEIIDCEGNEENGAFITGSISGSVMRVGFLEPANLLAHVNDTTNKTTVASDKDHFIITVNYPDEDGSSESESNYWVKKGDFVIDKLTYRVKFQGHYQYDEWNLWDLEFDQVSVAGLDNSMEAIKKATG